MNHAQKRNLSRLVESCPGSTGEKGAPRQNGASFLSRDIDWAECVPVRGGRRTCEVFIAVVAENPGKKTRLSVEGR